jgi:thiopurine S-methyltransferase
MDEEFWRERWERQEIAFHRGEVNPRLGEFWDHLGLGRGDPVLVPLCGKSEDMWWLRTRGHPVLGVELSPRAAAAFYAEHGLAPGRRHERSFEVFEADGIRILCGNVFDLTAEELAGVKGVYDRAALVALPPATRDRYAAHLAAVVPPATPMLLLTLEYPRGQMEGPPFSIPAEEVERLYGNRGHVRLLTRRSILSEEPRFAERGVAALDESAFLVTLET